jgi:hypothetical protein
VNPILLNWGPVAVIVGGYLLGFYFQNSRVSDLRAHVDRRISDLRAHVDGRIDDVRDGLRTEIRASQAELVTLIEKNHSKLMMKFVDLDRRLGRLETERRIVQ